MVDGVKIRAFGSTGSQSIIHRPVQATLHSETARQFLS